MGVSFAAMMLERRVLINFRKVPSLIAGISIGALSLAAVPASGQQIFVKSLFVANRNSGVCSADSLHPSRIYCPGPPAARCPSQGNISNDPHIEFDTNVSYYCLNDNPHFPTGDNVNNICNADVFLCAQVG